MNINNIQSFYRNLSSLDRTKFLQDLIISKNGNVINSEGVFHNVLLACRDYSIEDLIKAFNEAEIKPTTQWLKKEYSAINNALDKQTPKGVLKYGGLQIIRVVKENTGKYLKFYINKGSTVNDQEFLENLFKLLKKNSKFKLFSSSKALTLQGFKERKIHPISDYTFFDNGVSEDTFVNLIKSNLLTPYSEGTPITSFANYIITVWSAKHKANQNLLISLDTRKENII